MTTAETGITRGLADFMHRSHLHVHTLIEQAPLAIAMFDREMKYLAYSARWLREFGNGLTDLYGRCHYELNPDLGKEWKDAYRRGLAGETLSASEDIWIQADRSKSWLNWIIAPWHDDLDAVGGIIILAENITPRKKAEIALGQSETMFRELFELESDAILVVDYHTGNFLEVNAAAQALYGYSRSEFLAMRGQDISAEPEKTAAAIACRAPRSHLRWHRRKDGSTFPVEIAGTHFQHGDRELHVAAVRDISRRHQAELDLLSSRAQHEQAQTLAKMGSWHVSFGAHDSSGTWSASPELRRIFGLSDQAPVDADSAFAIVPPQDRERVRGLWEAAKRGEGPATWEHRIVVKGETRWVQVGVNFRRDGAGRPLEASCSCQDITELKRAKEELSIAALAFETESGVIVTDAHTVIIRVNRAFERLTGYTAQEVIGRTPALLQSGRQDRLFYKRLWEVLKRDGTWQGEIWNRRKNGEAFPEWLSISAVCAPDGSVTNYVGTFTDISRHKRAEAEIHRLSYYDALTQLPNRRLLLEWIEQAIARSVRNGRHGALLFLDLDHFKNLNDTRGHARGDELLVETARRIRAGVREGDTVAHLGGDEFVVLLEGLSADAKEAAHLSAQIGEKLRLAVARPCHIDGSDHYFTVSIGATVFRGGDEPADALLRHADLAMHRAKGNGRNSVRFFAPLMQESLDERSAVEADLRRALENDEFRIHYQAQVDAAGKVTGAEALLRWQHPKRGLIGPGVFIAIAEETDLILPIGQWVIERACAQLRAWSDDPALRELRLAVNVSARQFQHADFVVSVRDALRRSGANPARLKLEITESLLLESIVGAVARMKALRTLGVEFALDDFGTGFSSLAYLKRLPLSQLKIDRSFIAELSSSRHDATIVQTIITMAGNLGLQVIAEGVETQEQLRCLKAYGCVAFQGYLFSKPLPLEGFEKLLHGPG